MADLGLADVIRALRTELATSMIAAAGQELQFNARNIQVDLQLGVTKSADAKGGIHFWVIDLSGGGSYETQAIHKISLELEPILASGGRLRIASGTDQNPLGDSADDAHEPEPG